MLLRIANRNEVSFVGRLFCDGRLARGGIRIVQILGLDAVETFSFKARRKEQAKTNFEV